MDGRKCKIRPPQKGDPKAVKMELVCSRDRPAHRAEQTTMIPSFRFIGRLQAQSALDHKEKHLLKELPSLNDNVPAAVGAPTINITWELRLRGGGDNTWYEWGIPGDERAEGKPCIPHDFHVGLMAAGYNTADFGKSC